METLGDLYEGTTPAKAALRQYLPTLEKLLGAAHWTFARKTVTMILVADATAGEPTISPWIYEYLVPEDCMQVRFVPNQPSPWVQFQTASLTPIVAGVATVTPDNMSGTIN